MALGGFDGGSPNLDALGGAYITIAIIWTLFVVTGLFFLYRNRNEFAIKLRGFPILCGSIVATQIYAMIIVSVYPANGLFGCRMEFWFMSVIFPLAIALFQASNVRLLYYYDAQRRLSQGTLREKWAPLKFNPKGLLTWYKSQDYVKRTYVGIIVGLLCQLVLTIFLFSGSRRFHASHGIFGEAVDPIACRRGLEWLPSIFWHFLWTLFFGPYLLLQIRNIHDTHYWGWQTKLSVIAGLPGTPLWVTFLYVKGPTVDNINRYFVPAAWFLPGLLVMQLVQIVFPLLDVRQTKIRKMQFMKHYDPHSGTMDTTASDRRKHLLSMSSLEECLNTSWKDFMDWASRKTLTSETVLFLREVKDFRARWDAEWVQNRLTTIPLHERYRHAALIWFRLINPDTAELNINIDSRTYNELSTFFKQLRYTPEKAASEKSVSIVAPWETSDGASTPISEKSLKSISEDPHGCLAYANDFKLPEDFRKDGRTIFDQAYEIVKLDVFRNTWARLVYYIAHYLFFQIFADNGQ
ncbi:hypothetical protein M501DRAFT_925639 [Patellaria atrata CBS 101060]|uniref:RGS domain-containing protein n=1 Tax=Patellaria atrata CBS 101060 TaxID=1346257 RepID=A0A9P4SIY6_9PEZI|nr:hypothetical protein M501DRAFT_925639 [Patellaria atrata CBS 101060]